MTERQEYEGFCRRCAAADREHGWEPDPPPFDEWRRRKAVLDMLFAVLRRTAREDECPLPKKPRRPSRRTTP